MKCRHCLAELDLPLVDLGFAPPSNAYLTPVIFPFPYPILFRSPTVRISSGRFLRPLEADSEPLCMIVTTESTLIDVAGSPMRTFVARPKADGHYPGILFYSDIFQLTPTMIRACVRLAANAARSAAAAASAAETP